MRMTPEQITAFVKDMQNNDDIKKNAHPEYFVETHADIIHIYGHHNEARRTSTAYLSDIHAILRQCHPNGEYSVEIWPHGFEGYYEGPIYSHSHQPSAISANHHVNGGPRKHYTWNMQHIPDIIVPCDEPLSYAIKRASKHITKNFNITQKYPDIFHDYTSIKTTCYTFKPHAPHHNTHNMLYPIFEIDLCVKADKHSNDILLAITVKNSPFFNESMEFSIPPTQIAQLLPLYQTHIPSLTNRMHDFVSKCINPPMNDIQHTNQNNIANLDEINLDETNPEIDATITDITNHIHTLLTDTNGKLFHDIQRCIDILQNHYIYVPE